MNPSFWFDDVIGFATGTVGPRGQRTFFLQVHEDGSVVSFKVEKQQVQALASYLEAQLADLPALGIADVPDPTPLREPGEVQWPVGAMSVDFDNVSDSFVLMGQEVDFEEDDDDPDLATFRLSISRAQAHAFVSQAHALVAAGRPPCPYCGRPWEPADEFCVCHN